MQHAAGPVRAGSFAIGCVVCLVAVHSLAAPASGKPAANARRLTWANTQSVFRIQKSENRNEVHYAIRVDAQCHPSGKQPVFGYWREFEKGPRAVSPLLSHEQPAYGLMPPRSVERTASGGRVRVSLRAFPERLLTIEVQRAGTGCAARALTTIHKQPAMLNSIYVQIGFLFSVEYAIARGVRLPEGTPVQEKLDD